MWKANIFETLEKTFLRQSLTISSHDKSGVQGKGDAQKEESVVVNLIGQRCPFPFVFNRD